MIRIRDRLLNLKQIGKGTKRATAAMILCCSALIAVNAKARVETIQFRSPTINALLPYSVVLPTDYDASPNTRYPVLYLLHGLTGHYNDWVSRTNVADYAAQYRLILVTPEGNDTEDSPLIFPYNRELAALMVEKKIPHEYRELPGDHSWAYWDAQVQEVLEIAAKRMRFGAVRRPVGAFRPAHTRIHK